MCNKHVACHPINSFGRRHSLQRTLVKCETITISMCQGMPYNTTGFPNFVNDQNQEGARRGLNQFLMLINSQCSPYSRFFLCLLYTPVCNEELNLILPPCQKVCRRVQADCEDLISAFGYEWPIFLNCQRFPSSGLCASPNIEEQLKTYSDISVSEETTSPQTTALRDNTTTSTTTNTTEQQKQPLLLCPPELRVSDKLNYKLIIRDSIIQNCGAPCEYMFFTEAQVQFVRLFNGILSSISLIPCLFITLTFLVDVHRFQYPQRVVIFQSCCYTVVSITYYLAFVYRGKIACFEAVDLECPNQTSQVVSLVTQGTTNITCSLAFILIYFFSMAASIWSVIFALAWFLTATKKWCSESIAANYLYYHSISWGVPTIKTSVLLAYGYIDGDILSGVCNTGIFNTNILITLVLLPLGIYFILIIIFLVPAFMSMVRITSTEEDFYNSCRMSKLMRRFVFFSIVSTTSILISIGCLLYEYLFKDQWLTVLYSRLYNFTEQVTSSSSAHHKLDLQPSLFVLILKYTMVYINALLPAVWLLNYKTLLTWKKILFDTQKVRH